MELEPIDTCIVVYLVCLCAVFSVTRLQNRRCGSTWHLFFLSWGALLFVTKVCLVNAWPGISFTEYSGGLVNHFLVGCSLGYVGAILLVTGRPTTKREAFETIKTAEFIVERISTNVLLALFLLGMLFFIIRVSQTGFSGTMLSDLRVLYGTESGGLLFRVSSHVFVVSQIIMLASGVLDAKTGINLWRVFLVTLACAPLSLAQGGRTFLVAGFMYYTLSFWCTRLVIKSENNKSYWNDFSKITGAFALAMLAFAALGFARGGYGDEFNALRTIFVWPASSLRALDSWGHWSEAYTPSIGSTILNFPNSLLIRFGILEDTPISTMLTDGAARFMRLNDSSWCCPPTIIPYLILECGIANLALSSFFFGFLLEATVRLYTCRSWMLQSLSCQLLYIAAMSIQINAFNEMFFAMMFWSFVIGFLYRQYGQKPATDSRNSTGQVPSGAQRSIV